MIQVHENEPNGHFGAYQAPKGAYFKVFLQTAHRSILMLQISGPVIRSNSAEATTTRIHYVKTG